MRACVPGYTAVSKKSLSINSDTGMFLMSTNELKELITESRWEGAELQSGISSDTCKGKTGSQDTSQQYVRLCGLYIFLDVNSCHNSSCSFYLLHSSTFWPMSKHPKTKGRQLSISTSVRWWLEKIQRLIVIKMEVYQKKSTSHQYFSHHFVSFQQQDAKLNKKFLNIQNFYFENQALLTQ